MAHPKIPEDKLNEARAAIKAGATITAEAAKIGVHQGTLSRALDKRKQTKQELPPEQIPVVNQLEGRIALMQDENRVLRTQLRDAQMSSVSLKLLAEELKTLAQPIPPYDEMYKKRTRGPTKESAVLHLSDGHHDAVILPHRVQGFESHDFNVAMARGEYLVQSVLDFTQTNMVGYDFETLWILAYGDSVQGEIHGSVKNTHFQNVMKSCLAIGQFHAQMIRDFAQWFPQVKVLYLSGNHGRRKEVAKKDYQAAHDSWDYLVAETAKAYCRDLWNVEIMIPDSFSAVVNIEGYNFHCSHGDDIQGWAGIPFYGIERKTRRLTALNSAHDRKVHFYCMGHFHQLGTQAALKGETIINGSWIGTDPYAFNKMDAYCEPSQLLHGVHAQRGMTWRLPVKLRRYDESEIPKRYQVSIKNGEG